VIFLHGPRRLSANDGPTHHGLFDIAFLRCVPNVILMAPKDEDELVGHDVHRPLTRNTRCHPFIPRGPAEGVTLKESPRLLEIGRAEVIRNFANTRRPQGGLVTASGTCSRSRAKPADQLTTEGFDTRWSIPASPRPLDAGVHEFFGRATDVVLTFEDHAIAGGYGSAVMEHLAEKRHHDAGHAHRLAGPVHRARDVGG